MKRKFWIGASFSALVLAAMAPWSASQAQGVSVRVQTPEFGIRIGGAPWHRPPPVYYPAPVYVPPPVVYRPAPPVVYGYPYHYAGGGGYGYYRHHWNHRHWQHDGRRDGHGDRRGWR